MHADVKTHEILVLLLRLRQICVHPSLIHSMLDQEDMKESGINEAENVDPNLVKQMNGLSLMGREEEEEENEQEIGIDRRVATNLLTSTNPVFQTDRASSKVSFVMLRHQNERKQSLFHHYLMSLCI